LLTPQLSLGVNMSEAAIKAGHEVHPRRGFLPRLAGIQSASIPTRILGLDELRGIAVLVVMVAHGAGLLNMWPEHVTAYGVQGVYLFFAISGYLITRILLDATAKAEPLSTFFVRRFLRIWPLMLVALVASALLYPATSGSIAYNLILMNNYAMAGGITPPAYTDVMWSLAIEEQFYLIYPFVVLLLGRNYLPFAIGIIVFVGFSFEAGLFPSPENYDIRHATHGAMQYVAMGCAIALGVRGVAAAVIGALAAFVAFTLLHGLTQIRPVWFGVTFVCFAVTYVTVHMRPIIRLAPLAHIGRLCYGLYLIHFFVREFASKFFPHGPIGFAGYLIVSYVLALASFYLFESPILRSRKFFETSRAGQAALALGAALMVVSTLAVLTQSAAMANAQKTAEAKTRKDDLFSCAGVFLALGGDGSKWQDDYYRFLGKLEVEEGVEFSQRAEGARRSADAWATRPDNELEAETERCTRDYPAS